MKHNPRKLKWTKARWWMVHYAEKNKIHTALPNKIVWGDTDGKNMFKIRAKSKFDRQQSTVCNFLLPASCRPTDELVVRTAAEAISDCET